MSDHKAGLAKFAEALGVPLQPWQLDFADKMLKAKGRWRLRPHKGGRRTSIGLIGEPVQNPRNDS
jgi:hypothetical protein